MKRFALLLATAAVYISGLLVLNIGFAGATPPPGLDCSKSGLTAKEQIQCGACGAAGDASTASACNPGAATGSVGKTVRTIINLISLAAGAAAVIMLMIGGFKYATSSGNADAAKSARSTITYALLGLVIVGVAQIIVQFVIHNTAQ